MKLFHGTDDTGVVNILKDGYICNEKISECTEYYNDVLKFYLGECPRGACVYLTNDIVAAQVSYDNQFEIDVEGLDWDKLYVADLKLLEEVFVSGDAVVGRNLVTKFKDSIVNYSDFKESPLFSRKPHELEFLYYDKIFVKRDNLKMY